ncbi:MAG: transglycosylase domain-containing protein [Anaerolineaceae bacterium]|nr:transglycosylase domain-containing protein [Anaerolineaceae bacterium]
MTEEEKSQSGNQGEEKYDPMDRMRRLTDASKDQEKPALNYEHRAKRTSGQTGEWMIFETDRELDEDEEPIDPLDDTPELAHEQDWFVSNGEVSDAPDSQSDQYKETIPPTISQYIPAPELLEKEKQTQQPFLNQPLDEVDQDATQVTPVAYQISKPVKIPSISQGGEARKKQAEGSKKIHPIERKINPPSKTTKPDGDAENGKSDKKWNPGCITKILISFLFVLALIGISIITFLVFKYFSIAADLPDYSDLRSSASQFETTRILDRNGDLLYEINDPNAGRRTYVTLDKISPYLVAATIATEDKEYYNHPGFDPVAIARAMWQNYTGQDIVSGASTITQQLAKKLLFSPEERFEISIERKTREIVLAAEISRIYSKNEILELYLNENNYGNYSYGIQAAAEAYFDTSALALDLGQSAFLAGIPQAPAVHDIFTNRDEMIERFTQILVLMYDYNQEKGCIEVSNSEELVCVDAINATDALHEIENYEFKSHQAIMKYPHWVQYIRTLLEEEYGAQTIYRSGFTVQTTLDPEIQTFAEETVKEQIANLTENHATDGAVVVIFPKTGEILAMVGSADFYNEEIDGQVNMAVSPRQPGSSMKPLTYTAAFEKGWTPATIIWDVESEFPPSGNPDDPRDPYEPVNYDGRFHGPVTVRAALSNSFNVPAVKTLDYIGIYDDPDHPDTGGFIRFAERMGITTLTRDDYGLALTLGGGDVSLLELTGAYTVYANGGKQIPPVAILRVTDYQGNLVYEYTPPEGEQIIRAEHAFLISSILSDTNARIPAFGPNPVINLPFQAAAKTGTTNDFRDNWTMGFTPEIVVGVWVGNADYTPMQNTSGLTGAAPIWAAVMKEIIETRYDGITAGFKKPGGVEERTVCALSGAEPADWCPAQTTEYFAFDKLPLPASEDIYQRVSMDSWTKLIASPYCSENIVARDVLYIQDKWGRKWVEDTDAGKSWLDKIGYSGNVYYKPDRACKETDSQPEILFAGLSEGQTINSSPVDVYAFIKAGDNFKNYKLEYGEGSDPDDWHTLVDKTEEQYSQPELIFTWDVMDISSGTVTLRLRVNGKSETYVQKILHLNLAVPTPTPTITPTPTETQTSTNTLPPTYTTTPTNTQVPSNTATQTLTPTP